MTIKAINDGKPFKRCVSPHCHVAICHLCNSVTSCPMCRTSFTIHHGLYHSPQDAMVHIAYLMGLAEVVMEVKNILEIKAAMAYLAASDPEENYESLVCKEGENVLKERLLSYMKSLMPRKCLEIPIDDEPLVRFASVPGVPSTLLWLNVDPTLVSKGYLVSVPSFAEHCVGRDGVLWIRIQFHGAMKEAAGGYNVIGAGDATVAVKYADNIEDADDDNMIMEHYEVRLSLNYAPETCIKLIKKNILGLGKGASCLQYVGTPGAHRCLSWDAVMVYAIHVHMNY